MLATMRLTFMASRCGGGACHVRIGAGRRASACDRFALPRIPSFMTPGGDTIMLRRFRRTLLLPLLLLSLPVVHAAETPRTRVDGVAQAIEDRYFDAERGRKIAGDLRKAADAGEFDALAAPRSLADALTARLKPLDRHFRVKLAQPGEGGRRR